MTTKLYALKTIFLFGISSLWSAPQLVEMDQYMETNLNKIQAYEQAGDYAKALEFARKQNESPLTIDIAEKALLNLGYSRLIFDEHFQPRVKLLQLLDIVGMPPLNPSESAILQINAWAQKNLLRQGERWQEQMIQFEKLKSQIKPLLLDLGFIDATSSQFRDYQGAILHGAILPRVRIRLNYLVEQWKSGVRFSKLYFLSGARPLVMQHENKDCLMQDHTSPLKIKKDWKAPKEFPKTESEMIQLVWEQSDIPDDMCRNLEVHFINAPMKKDPKSENLLRPTTDDTIETWLKTAPLQGRYLAITNAPYTNRQDAVIRTIAPCEYGFDTIGPAADEYEQMAIYLDELARLIFQTKQFATKNGKIE
ncbi:MAG: hypothetical protein V4489_06110 [Chlamydiota bacterium]